VTTPFLEKGTRLALTAKSGFNPQQSFRNPDKVSPLRDSAHGPDDETMLNLSTTELGRALRIGSSIRLAGERRAGVWVVSFPYNATANPIMGYQQTTTMYV
jgi:hypothetical protein